MQADGQDLSDIQKVLDGIDLDRSVGALSHLYRGGTSEAKRMFRRFSKKSLGDYDANRNQPQTDYVSHMSKYLHFGHVSPIWLVLEARKSDAKKVNIESFVEELVVRRELSINFVFYNEDYDSYSNLPDWAKKTLREHKNDER
jgi:deoxyribodipyrimidine photo-lyase